MPLMTDVIVTALARKAGIPSEDLQVAEDSEESFRVNVWDGVKWRRRSFKKDKEGWLDRAIQGVKETAGGKGE
jgi:hypothetical protein